MTTTRSWVQCGVEFALWVKRTPSPIVHVGVCRSVCIWIWVRLQVRVPNLPLVNSFTLDCLDSAIDPGVFLVSPPPMFQHGNVARFQTNPAVCGLVVP